MPNAWTDTSYADLTMVSMTCACPLCQSMGGGSLSSFAKSAADGTHSDVRGAELIHQTQNADGTYSFSGDDNVDAVLIGSRWTSSMLTFTFPTDGSYDDTSYGDGQIPFNAAQQDAARAAFHLVEGYTLLTIKEVDPDAKEEPTFRLSQTHSPQLGSAQGSFPDYIDNEGGQIWFGRTAQPYYEAPEKGNWGYATILHEIGHTLGLKHGMDDYTNFNVGEIFGDGGTRYGSVAIEYDQDGQAWSLMTYTAAPNAITAFAGEGQNQPQSYMQLDIAALQYLYGANFATNADDTVYRWNGTTGEGFINDVGQGAPSGNKVFETIWDGGGVDTYDFSNYAGGMTVDLRPGAFTAFSTEQTANNAAFSGGHVLAPGNIANALLYEGNVASQIENAIGGAGKDTILGNQVANGLSGGDGDDLLAGFAGSDVLDGGEGNDVVDFAGATTGIEVMIDPDAEVKVANGDDTDTLVSVEGVLGTAFDDRLTGDGGANVLAGGAGGHDVLRGRGGDDELVGGGYKLAWRDEPDIVRAADIANHSLDTAVVLDGAFDLVAHAGVSTAVEYPGATLPHATVIAEAATTAGNDYYRFEASASARALFDIDGTTYFTGLEVLDGSGNILASNYGDLTTDEGSRGGYDARLAYTFQAEGTYYIRVTGSTYNQIVSDLLGYQPYTLNVSLENAVTEAPELRQTASADFDGGDGRDVIVGTAGDDHVRGGKGQDTLSYANHYKGVTVMLATAAAQATGAGSDTIVGVENLIGSAYGDTLVGTSGRNVIDGHGGGDILVAGGGIDTLSFASQSEGVAVSLASQGGFQHYRFGERVLATGFENLTGTMSDDTLSGDGHGNWIRGLGGKDILAGGVPDVVGAMDRLNGGTGRDVADFGVLESDLQLKLRDDGFGRAVIDGEQIASLKRIEGLVGGAGNDRLTGNDGANALSGGAGADLLQGHAGRDVLTGGEGDDVLNGGDGTDIAIFDGAVAAHVDLDVTQAQDTGYGLDRLIGIENLQGGAGDDTFLGSGDANVFYDTTGSDLYDGRGDRDTVDFSGRAGGIVADLTQAATQVAGDGSDTLIDIENVIGGQGSNLLIGGDADNRLVGGAEVDILIGGAGGDTLVGGDGDDFLTGDNFALGPQGARGLGDALLGGGGFDTIFGGAGPDRIDGGDGDDFLSNGTFASSVDGTSWTRGLLIRADGGDDDIDGGLGVDFAVLSYVGRAEGVTVDVRDASVRTDILSGGTSAGSIASVETLGFEGGEGDDTVYGGAGYDFLAGHGGDDVIFAGAGDDVVYYDGGKDAIDGGVGFDAVSFEDADRGVTYDVITGKGESASDAFTASGFETAVSSAFGDTLRLADWDDSIYDDGVGDDRFYGRGGTDAFTVVRSGAEASSVTLAGGQGNDRLNFTAVHAIDDALVRLDRVTVSGGDGNDFIVVSGARTATISGGAGDDVVIIDVLGAPTSLGRVAVSLGKGRDSVVLSNDEQSLLADQNGTVVSDFSVADDRIDVTGIVTGITDGQGNIYPTLIGYVSGQDPFGAGYLRLVQQGADTLVQADMDADGGAHAFVTLLTMQGVDASALTGANFGLLPFDLGISVPMSPQSSLGQHLVGTDADDVQVGSHLGNGIVGAGGDDVLRGRGGADSLLGGDGGDLLVGGRGADVMNGGAGDDTYVVDNAKDAIQELYGDGNDSVRTSVSYDMRDYYYVEDVVVTGRDRVDVTGNFVDNVIHAASGGGTLDGYYGNDTLIGGGGVDTLIGFDGDDLLTGGEAGDAFMFDNLSATGADRITDLGASDQLLFTVSLVDADGDGVIALDNGLLALADGFSIQIDGAASLTAQGSVERDGVTYAAYGLQASPSSSPVAARVTASAFETNDGANDAFALMEGRHDAPEMLRWDGLHLLLV